jgi:hypothetical protein
MTKEDHKEAFLKCQNRTAKTKRQSKSTQPWIFQVFLMIFEETEHRFTKDATRKEPPKKEVPAKTGKHGIRP